MIYARYGALTSCAAKVMAAALLLLLSEVRECRTQQQLACYLQYMEGFYGMMEALKTDKISWDDRSYGRDINRLACAFRNRYDVLAAEQDLREALSAKGLDTLLAQGALQNLKVCAACIAYLYPGSSIEL